MFLKCGTPINRYLFSQCQFKISFLIVQTNKLIFLQCYWFLFLRFGARSSCISAEKLLEFLNREQRDPRLNEILDPYYTISKAVDLIMNYECNEALKMKGKFIVKSYKFINYLFYTNSSMQISNYRFCSPSKCF